MDWTLHPWRNHITLDAQSVNHTELNKEARLLYTSKQGGSVYGIQLDRGHRLANLGRSGLCRRAGCKHPGVESYGGQCLHTISISAHETEEGFVQNSPEPHLPKGNLRVGVGGVPFSLGLRLRLLTWPCPDQQHTFSQDVTHLGLPGLPTNTIKAEESKDKLSKHKD